MYHVLVLVRNAMVPGNLRVSGQNKVKCVQKWGKKQGILGCHEGQNWSFSLVFAYTQGSLL
jgi:hypothetical protein